MITSSTVPTENTTYKAKWHYEADNSIQTFNLNTDVLNTYFTRVNTSKQDESTFKNKMDENFNANSCYCRENTCTGGSVHCDKLKGYDTGRTFQGACCPLQGIRVHFPVERDL